MRAALCLAGLSPLAAPGMNCGPHLATYEVADAATPNVRVGLRCVDYASRGLDGSGRPVFGLSWYGEDRRGNASYRQVGGGFRSDYGGVSSYGYAAYLVGQGESYLPPTGDTLRFEPDDAANPPAQMRMTPNGNTSAAQIWRRVSNSAHIPLATLQQCGPDFITYEVRAPGATPSTLGAVVEGVRCVYEAWHALPATQGVSWFHWIGTGRWDGSGSWGGPGTYTHLGSALASTLGSMPPDFMGAKDGCDGSVGATCHAFGFRTVSFARATAGTGYRLSGAWNEAWVLPGSYRPPAPRPAPDDDPWVCRRKPWLCP